MLFPGLFPPELLEPLFQLSLAFQPMKGVGGRVGYPEVLVARSWKKKRLVLNYYLDMMLVAYIGIGQLLS